MGWRMFDAILLSLPYIYGVSAVVVLIWASPIGFQRMGSIGVAIVLVLFGVRKVQRTRRGKVLGTSDDVKMTEITLAGAATVQWGYGDLFSCWVHGNGWTPCG